MALSAATGVATPVHVTEAPKVQTTGIQETSKKQVEKTMSTESYVRQYFADAPIMIQIAKCESRFRQLDNDGSVHRGEINPADVGVMQINEYYHGDEAKKQNYNLYSLEGNVAYARRLYEREGTQPWIYSKGCWGKYENSSDLAVK